MLDSPNATVMLDSEREETLGAGSHNDHITDESSEVVDKSLSVPAFLRKVFAAELGNDAGGRDQKLMVIIAVHSVLLESGFVGFNETANVVVDGFQLRNDWPSVSVFYTLPESAQNVVLKFQSLGKFMNVYGITLGDGSAKRGPYHAQLNEDELVPSLMEIVSGQDGDSSKEVLIKFWMTVKDKVALPLLIELCEEAGLELPPCFIRLPTELKLKILESLRGVDVAIASSVCSELRCLASSDELWKVKIDEEFRGHERKEAQVSWKKAYSMLWSRRRVKTRLRASMPYWPQPQPNDRRRRYPSPSAIQGLFVDEQRDDLQTLLIAIHTLRPEELINLGVSVAW